MTLSRQDRLAGNGTKPWCGGISSGTATGWPATDWLEEAVLGSYGGQVYDDWVSHKVKFARPQIQAAMTDRRQLDAEPGVGQRRLRRREVDRHHHVPGRRPADPEGQVRDAAAGVVLRGAVAEGHQGLPRPATSSPSTCRRSARRSRPRSRAAASSSPRSPTGPASQAVQNYLSSAEWADSRIKVAPGWVSANQKVDQSLYTDPIDQLSAKYLTDPKATFRFDASDPMPAAVGSGAEWKAMIDWFGRASRSTRGQGDRRRLAALDSRRLSAT